MKIFDDKRALWPSFFMSLALVSILALSLYIHNYSVWFVSLLIILIFILYNVKEKIVLNSLFVCVLFFLLLLYLNVSLISPINNIEAIYLVTLFTLTFLLFYFTNEKLIENVFLLLISIFFFLSIWGLIQYLTGSAYIIQVGNRANSAFYTPNTFAGSINIIFLPLIIIYLLDITKKPLLAFILLLFSALLVTQSRGGWASFITTIFIVFVFIKFTRISLNFDKLKKLIIGIVLVIICYLVINQQGINNDKSDVLLSKNIDHLIRSDSIVSTMSHRLMLYNIAWQEIKKTPFLGKGLHSYQYYQIRDQELPHIGNRTRYTHNDYLQLWMETGVLGLVFFVLIFLLLVYHIIKLKNIASTKDISVLLALIAGLCSFYVHALVDFMFYVPFMLFMYAFYLGVFSRIINKYHQHQYHLNLSNGYIRFSLLKVVSALLFLVPLSMPAIGQIYYHQAINKKNILDFSGSLKSLAMARRFMPDEADYYWFEGALLMNAVKDSQLIDAAVRADELFKKGMNLNFYDTKNRLARAELHREHGHLLGKQVKLDEVIVWNEEALSWRPNDPIVQSEYLKSLIKSGEYDKAQNLLKIYILQTPNSIELDEIKRLYFN